MVTYTLRARLTSDPGGDENRSFSFFGGRFWSLLSPSVTEDSILELPHGRRGCPAGEERAVHLEHQGRKAVRRARKPQATGPSRQRAGSESAEFKSRPRRSEFLGS